MDQSDNFKANNFGMFSNEITGEKAPLESKRSFLWIFQYANCAQFWAKQNNMPNVADKLLARLTSRRGYSKT